MAIFKARVQSEYAQIPNATLQDKTISFEAKGLLAMLLSMPEDWELVKEWMVKQSPNCGRDKLDRILKELQLSGYIRKEINHGDNGQFSGVNWFVYPTATLETRTPAKPDSGKTATTKETVKQKKQETKETFMSPTGSACSQCGGCGWDGVGSGQIGYCNHCKGTGKEPTCNDGLQVVNSELTTEPPKADKPKRNPKWQVLKDEILANWPLIASADDYILTEWCKLRIRKGAKGSDIAHKFIEGQITILMQYGLTVSQILETAIIREWRGIEAEWFNCVKDAKRTGIIHAQPEEHWAEALRRGDYL